MHSYRPPSSLPTGLISKVSFELISRVVVVFFFIQLILHSGLQFAEQVIGASWSPNFGYRDPVDRESAISSGPSVKISN